MIQSVLICLEHQGQGRFAFCGPYTSVYLRGMQVWGCRNEKGEEIVATWNGTEWMDSDSVAHTDVVIIAGPC